MCCSTLFGFVLGVVLFKMIRRFAYWRGGGCDGGGGGRWGGGGHWGGGHWHGGGDGFWQRRGYSRWSRFGQGTGGSGGARSTGKPFDELVRGLELNERQQTEAQPVFSFVKERLGSFGPRPEAALAVLAAEQFDPAPLLSQIGDLTGGVQRDLVEGLEHVHTILISEQREHLRKQLGTAAPESPPPANV